MKMKMWDRVILCCGVFLSVASSLLLFLHGLQANSALYILCALLLAAFGVYLGLVLRRCYVKRNDFVVQRTESGELRIAVKAIENQVQKCIDLHEEIRVNSMNILTTREGVVVDLLVTLANNISIPLAVASLQKQIKQYLVASSGIEVKEVRVSVESTQNAILPDASETEGEQPAAKEEKKAPMHQRLFGRADEPAIVPEPPKEECREDEEAATEAETEEAAEVEEERNQSVSAWLKPEEETEEPSAEAPAEEAPAIPEAAPEAEETEKNETAEEITAEDAEALSDAQDEPDEPLKPLPEPLSELEEKPGIGGYHP